MWNADLHTEQVRGGATATNSRKFKKDFKDSFRLRCTSAASYNPSISIGIACNERDISNSTKAAALLLLCYLAVIQAVCLEAAPLLLVASLGQLVHSLRVLHVSRLRQRTLVSTELSTAQGGNKRTSKILTWKNATSNHPQD